MKHRTDRTGGRPELVDPVQRSYATLLAKVVTFNLILLFLGFIVYATGIVPASVSIATVPSLWHLDAAQFAERTGGLGGWSWLSSLDDGRTIAFASLVLFPASMIAMTAAAALLYASRRVVAYALITSAVLVVLLIAALGVGG